MDEIDVIDLTLDSGKDLTPESAYALLHSGKDLTPESAYALLHLEN